MSSPSPNQAGSSVERLPAPNSAGLVVVCEHASPDIPARYHGLGLSETDRLSHAVWDPGARQMAVTLAQALGGVLIASRVSRLVYDCNRPPEAPDAMPAQSEAVRVPGNASLSHAEKAARVAEVYAPFKAAVAAEMAAHAAPVLITVHTFTPVYHGTPRPVEIGVLHDTDARLADALLAAPLGGYRVERNAPYGPEHGVTHTLKTHALPGGHLNVMLEVRNDLVPDEAAQTAMGARLATWIEGALAQLEEVRCSA
ncbi:N-formylglutamate amidohydrolase [Pseudaestuariivita sp.]|uniref:N-formylglutamate amidohydrolase n=1 Tax=Pseudaestuariivita sp. TaxID=2211669 RepID=UPI00405A254A